MGLPRGDESGDESDDVGGARWNAAEGRWSDGNDDGDHEDNASGKSVEDSEESSGDASGESDGSEESETSEESDVDADEKEAKDLRDGRDGRKGGDGNPSASSAGQSIAEGGSRPFAWRPVVPRGAGGKAAARVRASQQEQREKLLARLFPHESFADQQPPHDVSDPAVYALATRDDDLRDIDSAPSSPAHTSGTAAVPDGKDGDSLFFDADQG